MTRQHRTPQQALCVWVITVCCGLWALTSLQPAQVCAQTTPPPSPSNAPLNTPQDPKEAAQTHDDTTPEDDTDWFVLPALKYNDDEGFAYGIRAAFVRLHPVSKPYDWRLYLKLNHSTRNRHDHAFLFDNVDILDTSLRIIAFGAYQTIDDAVFAGIGNNTPTPDFTRDTFAIKLPRGRVLAQSFIHQTKWLVGGGLTTSYASISNIPQGSVLDRLSLPGKSGGWAISPLLFAGYDSRDNELAPTQGVYAEVYISGTSTAALSSFNTLTVGAQAAHFLPFTPRLIFAQRVFVEDLSGDVPFYELTRLGGRFRPRGIGGTFTQRGFIEGRFAGRTKSIFNNELRYSFPSIWDGLILGLAPFTDISHVWDETDTLSGFFDNLNATGGGELSVRWRDSFLIRFDYAVSREDRLVYIQAQHMF